MSRASRTLATTPPPSRRLDVPVPRAHTRARNSAWDSIRAPPPSVASDEDMGLHACVPCRLDKKPVAVGARAYFIRPDRRASPDRGRPSSRGFQIPAATRRFESYPY